MGLFKFALLCIDLLAWPVIALGYPLFASIRAVETGSKPHMKKLVIYWTLFSLFSLFEFAFVRIIEWIPFWSSVRLVVIVWLVIPRFDGACIAYEGLVRPVLGVKVQEAIKMFYKMKEVRLSKREVYLDVVEKYIKENGSEALEKLIAFEHESKKCINFQRDSKILEAEMENAVVTTKQLNEADADADARRDTEMVEAIEKSATMTKQVENAQSASSASVLTETDVVTNVKETTPLDASTEITPLDKTHQEWTCDLCTVTATTETMLNDHLQGRKHKSKLESLKASMQDAKDTGPSPVIFNVHQHEQSVHGSRHKSKLESLNVSKLSAKGTGPSTSATSKLEKLTANEIERGAVKNEWRCDLCKVKVTSETTLKAHLKGSKHKDKLIESLKTSKDGEGSVKKHYTGSKENTQLQIFEPQWCYLCNLKLLSEANVVTHLKGNRHKSNVEALMLTV